MGSGWISGGLDMVGVVVFRKCTGFVGMMGMMWDMVWVNG